MTVALRSPAIPVRGGMELPAYPHRLFDARRISLPSPTTVLNIDFVYVSLAPITETMLVVDLYIHNSRLTSM